MSGKMLQVVIALIIMPIFPCAHANEFQEFISCGCCVNKLSLSVSSPRTVEIVLELSPHKSRALARLYVQELGDTVRDTIHLN